MYEDAVHFNFADALCLQNIYMCTKEIALSFRPVFKRPAPKGVHRQSTLTPTLLTVRTSVFFLLKDVYTSFHSL